MPQHVIFPDCNPVQFAQVGKTKDARYNTRHLNDGWWFSEQIRDTNNPQDKVKYRQKWLHNDIINIQVSTNADSSPTLALYNCHDMLIADDVAYDSVTISGNIHPDGTALDTYQWWFSPDFFGAGGVNGDYYFLITSEFGSDEIIHISEPQYFSNSHPDTIFIKYNHPVNKEFAIFEQLYNKYGIRIEGALHGYDAASENTGFVDQDGTFIQLDSVTSEIWRLTLSGKTGIPDYLIKKLNEIFSLENISIDNKLFSRDEGSKFEYQGIQQYPLRGVSIQLRKKDNPRALITSDAVTDFYSTSTYPHYAYDLLLSDGINNIPIQHRVVEDLTDGQAWATSLNSSGILAANELTGFFSFADGKLSYNNDDGEGYVASGFVLSKYMTVDFTISSTVFDFIWNGIVLAVDWSDGNLEVRSDAVSYDAFTHTFSTSGSKTIRLFHNDFVYSLIFSYASLSFKQINDITGNIPASCASHTITYGDLDAGYDMEYLEPTAALGGMTSLVVKNSGMTYPFLSTFLDAGSMPNLLVVDLRNNEISVTGVNDFIDQYYNKIDWNINPASKYIKLEGQSPSAAPTGTAITQIALMQAAGVNITTD